MTGPGSAAFVLLWMHGLRGAGRARDPGSVCFKTASVEQPAGRGTSALPPRSAGDAQSPHSRGAERGLCGSRASPRALHPSLPDWMSFREELRLRQQLPSAWAERERLGRAGALRGTGPARLRGDCACSTASAAGSGLGLPELEQKSWVSTGKMGNSRENRLEVSRLASASKRDLGDASKPRGGHAG